MFIKPVRTAPPVLKCILAGIPRTMLGTPLPYLCIPETDAIGRLVHLAMTEQDEISWDHMLKGRINRKWHVMQQCYYLVGCPTEKTLGGNRWAKRSVCGLWHIYDGLWKTRNNIIHNKEVTRIKELQWRVQSLYKNPHLFIDETNMGLFHCSRDGLLQ